ncbi:hypothetical protein F4859DRAFT_519849 [Xylaria cf. heliscus]|nr:hypothetical protein F4859DRAFT_519849 [Xylaria cf. heliscus]
MQFRAFCGKIRAAFQQAHPYQGTNSSQEHLLPAVPPTTQRHPVSSGPPSYESLQALNHDRAPANFARRLGRMFTSDPSCKTPKPVSAEHRLTLQKITLANAEVRLSHALQAATEREARRDSAWDYHKPGTPSDIDDNDNMDDDTEPGAGTEELYRDLLSIIGVDIGPQLCLPGAPRAKLLGEKLAHLRKLDSLQRQLADCDAQMERCQRARLCPRYSGMSAVGAMRRIGELTGWRGSLTSQIKDVKGDVAWVDRRMEEMIREYDAMGF